MGEPRQECTSDSTVESRLSHNGLPYMPALFDMKWVPQMLTAESRIFVAQGSKPSLYQGLPYINFELTLYPSEASHRSVQLVWSRLRTSACQKWWSDATTVLEMPV